MDRRKFWKTDWVLLAALFLLVSLHFWFPNIRTGPAHDTFSTTAEGKKAFYLLVRQQAASRGIVVRRNLNPLLRWNFEFGANASGTPVLCLLGPQRYPTSVEWEKLLEWVSSGGILVLAARYNQPEFKIEDLELEVKRLNRRLDAGPQDIQTDLVTTGNVFWKSKGRVVASANAAQLVNADGTLQAVSSSYGSGRIVVVASDFIFSNQSLAWDDNSNGELAYRLLEWVGGDGNIYFDESLNISGTPKVVGLLFDPMLRPVTVQLLLGLLLFGWWRRRRFGPLLPKTVTARHNIVDHTDALGILNYKTKNGVEALRSYLKQLHSELRLKSFKGRENQILDPIAVRMGTS
ncbi:MAG: DUF4350 domain-containing protein, partial [Planctomycetes bacterium]|nr:DUF4350 domain-containing protein [Planctomycetota bacterium]